MALRLRLFVKSVSFPLMNARCQSNFVNPRLLQNNLLPITTEVRENQLFIEPC